MRRIDRIKSDLVEKLGTELKTWEASVRWVALLDNLGIGGLYRAANRAGKYCEFWVQNSSPIFTILSVRLSVTRRDIFIFQIIFLLFFPLCVCLSHIVTFSFYKIFPPFLFPLFFFLANQNKCLQTLFSSYANLILSLFKYFPPCPSLFFNPPPPPPTVPPKN